MAPDIDALVAELAERVEERRRRGEYPPGLEEDLSRHYRMILAHRVDDHPSPDLHGPLGRVRETLPSGPPPPPLDSDVPGGRALHAAVARLVGRHTQGVSQQLSGFAEPVAATLAALVEAVEELARDVHVTTAAQLHALTERQAAQERAMARAGLAPADAPPPAES